MKLSLVKIYAFAFLLMSVSCSKRLDYSPFDITDGEVVNGIMIQWGNGVSEEKQEIIRSIVNDMVFVEGGCFSMGVNQVYDHDARSNESPVHYVSLTDFYICSHELTAEQVARLADNPSHVFPSLNSVHFSYHDWKLFVDELNGYTGLMFDFPTEAQWEYAARGGRESRNFLYPGSDSWSMVWCDGSEECEPSVPNELGLFNMADSRAEWCKDMYNDYDATVISINPCNLYGEHRVVRGGCSESNSKYKNWFSEISITYKSFYSSKEDYRLCRSTARSYNYDSPDANITWRPVINIQNDEK